ncbi:MAG: glycosyltransferase family 4 protein [Rhodospirillales bacterium]|nr:glycosyltransferase family 4 protein [Alphaproteobacteria bacterium]MCB9986303.1 glycosyltransferase family 4 protein [Rhodospirillales bacterium]USO07144.1 MAG: glycosyltransferase family 4 protein [Rhodospirillales bacterium]
MSTRPGILIVNRAYPPLNGATGRLLHDLARHLVKSGYNVTILATGEGKPGQSRRGAIGITRVRAGGPGFWRYLALMARLARAMLRAGRHDIVITLSDPPMLYVLGDLVARRWKAAHIHWCHDLYPDLFPVLDMPVPPGVLDLLRRYGRYVLRRAACVVTLSRCMQRYITRTGLDIRRTAVIENWPDAEQVDETAPAMPDRPLAPTGDLPHRRDLRGRRLYSDPTGEKFRVLYAGSIGRAHPVEAIVQAARILLKAQPDIELTFVGQGPGFERLAQLRAQGGLDNIRLMPPQPRAALRTLMESGDVHLVTMRDEALGMLLPSKFYGALGARRPCVFVGPAESDIARIIARYACGQVVRPGDGKQLAAAIALYRNDAEAWFAAHEGAQAALKARLPREAFALWSNVIKKVLHDHDAARPR